MAAATGTANAVEAAALLDLLLGGILMSLQAVIIVVGSASLFYRAKAACLRTSGYVYVPNPCLAVHHAGEKPVEKQQACISVVLCLYGYACSFARCC